jgi:hypothetical protein
LDARPAVDLIEGVARLEQQLLFAMSPDPGKVSALQTVAWKDVGNRVYPSMWAETVAGARPHVAGLEADGLAGERSFYVALGRKLGGDQAVGAPDEALACFAASTLGAFLALHLSRSGWDVGALPGEPVVLRRDGVAWEPFTRLIALALGTITIEDWRADCSRVGLSGLALGAVAGAPERLPPGGNA